MKDLLPSLGHDIARFIAIAVISPSLTLAADELPSIAKMPDLPQPFVLRDWHRVATDYDRFVFDREKKGDHLPLYWEESTRVANDVDGFGIPAYVGDFRQTPASNAHEAINTMSVVLGGTLVGLDKEAYAAKLRSKFHKKDGIGLYLNHYTTTGSSYWYDTFPSLLFLHLYSHYPDIPGYREQLVSTAEVWRKIAQELDGDFEHTGYDFIKKQPVDHGWKEPDVVAGIACIQYLCHLVTEDKQYLETASKALKWMDRRTENPFYENLAPYGAYISARSNAEQGTQHDTAKFIEWVLNGKNPRKWGAVLESWHGTGVHGLIGSVYPEYEYAFAMNSFQSVGIMAPIARYEDRYARDIAKWILNVAVNARYFYPNAWPADNQSSWQWAATYDPDFCIPYEGLRKQGTTRDYPEGDELIAGTFTEQDDPKSPEKDMILTADSEGGIHYRGKLSVPPGTKQELIALVSHRTYWNKQPVKIQLSQTADGPAIAELTYRADGTTNLRSTPCAVEGDCWITIAASGLVPEKGRVVVDDLLVETRFANPPHVGGDPTVHGWGATDLGLYGGAHAAFLGAMVKPSSVEGIILIDPIATDMMAPPSYPTRLIYNPHPTEKTITLEIGDQPKLIYDAIGNHTLSQQESGNMALSIPAKSARMIVMPPPGELSAKEARLYSGAIVVDYSYPPTQ